MKAEEELNAKMLLCSHCPKEFRYNSEKKRHELSHFPHFECETCSKKFSFVSALRRHQKQHERTGSVKCAECHRKFRDEVLLKRHIKYAHKGTFICKECSSKFCSELALRTHMKTHKPESERRFKCSHEGCTKTFNFSHHLKHHELTHTNAKQHYCCYCGKGFIQSHHLKTHLKAHIPTGWFYCKNPGCKKKFSTDYARKRHMTTHKNKTDSGISSDSNSCNTSITSTNEEESMLCATCGETVLQNKFIVHSEKCIEEESDITAINNKEDTDNILEEWPNSPFKPSVYNDGTPTNKSVQNNITNCSNCVVKRKNYPSTQNITLVNEDDVTMNDKKDDSIANMSKNNQTTASFLYKDNINNELFDGPKPTIVKIISLTDYNQNQIDMCEGCDCANICDNKISMYLLPEDDQLPKITVKDSDVPNIEYRIDGVIKIKDTFDDIVLRSEIDEFIPFGTCKDVIGNCLVSGGDGCLCARMMAEDQAVMAQEIEDITPHPTELL